MSAEDVVTASLRGLELARPSAPRALRTPALVDAVFRADLAAFGARSPELATRYRVG